MTSDARRTIMRSVEWTVLVHTGFVLMMVMAKNANAPWWKIGKVFRLIELPVVWAVDGTMQRLPLIPPWAAFSRMSVTSAVSEFIAYSVFVGAFYRRGDRVLIDTVRPKIKVSAPHQRAGEPMLSPYGRLFFR
jgi:hypothetical protein